MSAPASTLNVCSGVRLNNSYQHTIYFSSSSDQWTYFNSKVVRTFSAYTFLRKSWSIKVAADMEDAQKWTYAFFTNNERKAFYYFVTNIEYINDGTVELFLELDVMQTYLFDYTLLPCFVEREHVADDTLGKHLLDEGLDVGELITTAEVEPDLQSLCVLVLSTFDPLETTEENTTVSRGGSYSGIYSGLGLYAVTSADYTAWTTKLNQLDTWGKSDGIISMWVYPKELITLKTGFTWSDGRVCKPVAALNALSYTDLEVGNAVNGYTPRNSKLLTYPYSMIYVTNNNGNAATYRYEYFGDPYACRFRTVGTLSADANVHLYPLNYNGVQHNFDAGLALAGFPACAWDQDVFKMWVAQNQNQNKMSAFMAGGKIVAGMAAAVTTGGLGVLAGAGTVASGFADIAGMMAQYKDREIQPPQARGQSAGSVAIYNNFQTYSIQRKTIRAEVAKTIDAYFDMYGYKQQIVKVPNRAVRTNWTYTKTVGCKIAGNICSEDQTKIESIYNQGVTFWRSGDNVGNYALTNVQSSAGGD